jgi:hypothetical protein
VRGKQHRLLVTSPGMFWRAEARGYSKAALEVDGPVERRGEISTRASYGEGDEICQAVLIVPFRSVPG